MKKILISALVALVAPCAFAQTSVGVSIGIQQPGVYGRIHIGDAPRPALVLPQPVIVSPSPVYMERQPIYLYVPPGHQKNWRRYCNSYNACGQPVYFVQEEWVRERYEREHPRGHRGERRGHGRDHEDRHGHKEDKHKGRGRGGGHGHHGRD